LENNDIDGLNKWENALITLFNPFTKMDEARHSSQGLRPRTCYIIVK